jgi:membrane-associated phospholipid phosphatase
MLAQSDSSRAVRSSGPSIGDTLWSDTKALWTDGLLLFSAPAHFGVKGWALTGGALAGTGLTMLADDPVRNEFREAHNSFKDQVTDLGNFYGTGLPGGVVVIGLYTTGLAFDAPGVRLAGRHIAQSLLYAGLTTTVLKIAIGRHRPYLNDGTQAYDPFKGPDGFHSLPSGHTTVAFAISSSLAADIDNPWATVGLYGVAALTAASRIYVDRHWLSDTFLGAAIGTACGWGVVHLHDRPGGDHSSLYLIPSPNSITAVWTF